MRGQGPLLETGGKDRSMLKKAFRFMVPCASGTLALLFLLNGPLSGLVRGEAVQQQRQQRAAPIAEGLRPPRFPGRKTL